MLLPLLWVCMGFLAGIVAAAHLQLSLFVWLALAFVALVLSVLQPRLWPASSQQPGPSRLLVLFISLLGLCLGAARYQLTVHRTSVTQIDWFNGRQYDVLVTGTLVDPPDYRDTYTNLRVSVRAVDTGSRQFEVGGLLLARVDPNHPYQYGQNVRLRGRLETPPANEDFSYRDYLARQDVYSTMPAAAVTILPGSSANPMLAAVYKLKAKLLDRLYRIFLDPEASLLAGILLGVDTRLPQPVQQAFKDTGTAHIIAISGFNIAIIAGIFILFFGRLLGPRLGAVVAVVGILAYSVLVGPEPSVVRAALMGMLSLFAVQVGRRQVGINTLAFVAALMAAWNPQVLWDVGFQLSFFATLGLILYGAPFQSATERFLGRYFPASNAARLSGLLAEFVLLTLAAQLTTLPIMAYHFKQISLVSFIANPFILPAQPAVMILGGVALAGGFLSFPLGRLLGLAAWPLTAYTIRMVEFFDSLPHGLLYLGGSSLAFVVCFYALLFGVTFGASQIKAFYQSVRQRFRFLTISLVLAALFICTLLVWRIEAARPDGKLHVTFISAGSADAVLVQTPGGR
ncbi:MAG TPA: ComEC/Rec2 family competence protein, partial [Anaerolineae bacterium]